jgi:hypothetical protein
MAKNIGYFLMGAGCALVAWTSIDYFWGDAKTSNVFIATEQSLEDAYANAKASQQKAIVTGEK